MTAATVQEVAAHTQAADNARREGFTGLASAHDALAIDALRRELPAPRPRPALNELCECGECFASYCPEACVIGRADGRNGE
jgi:hypothetical protein